MALRFTNPLTEMSTRTRKIMFLGSRAQPVSPLSKQCGILNISRPHRPPQPVAGIALLVFFFPTTVMIGFSIKVEACDAEADAQLLMS
jgi:hypothetical protein